MKPSEMYNKYWNGPPLSEHDALILDTAFELGVPTYIRVHRRRGSLQYIINPIITEHLKQKEDKTNGTTTNPAVHP